MIDSISDTPLPLHHGGCKKALCPNIGNNEVFAIWCSCMLLRTLILENLKLMLE